MIFTQEKGDRTGEVQVSRPLVDVFESEREVLIELEMPGSLKEDLKVELEDDRLRISGRSSQRSAPDGYTPILSERAGANYEREFVLGAQIQKDRVKARYENGILRVTLFKVEKPVPAKIVVE